MPPDSQRRWVALFVLTLARIAMGFQFQSVASAAATLEHDFQLTSTALGTLIGLYFLPGIVFSLPAGALGRRFGDARMVMCGLVLMAAGGGLCGIATSPGVLMAGRLVAGTGGILLNVLMSKMIVDWFSGRELFLAMSVFANAFPVGVGAAIATLGSLSAGAGWPTSSLMTALLAGAALILIALFYPSHSNDRGASQTFVLGLREAVLVCVAGAVWGLFNGCFSLTYAFGPPAIERAGLTTFIAALVGSVSTWLVVASVIVGGLAAQRGVQPLLLMAISAIGWSLCLAVLAIGGSVGTAVSLIVAGLVLGLPVGVILALPSQLLSPQSRGLGMGLFYTWLYVGHGLIPPAAGWLEDATGLKPTPLLFASALVITMLPLFILVRRTDSITAKTSAVED